MFNLLRNTVRNTVAKEITVSFFHYDWHICASFIVLPALRKNAVDSIKICITACR